MCKFCEGESYTHEIIISDENDKMCLNLFDKLEVAAGWDNPIYAEFSIKYCPMCGRILEENE